jgi:hypothetical protein
MKRRSALFEIDGEYPRQMRVAELEVTRGYDDWLSALMTEPLPAQRNDDEIAPDAHARCHRIAPGRAIRTHALGR